MSHDPRSPSDPGAGSSPGAPRVKTIACLGGVSLERGVPSDEIHDYIRDAHNLVWVDVQDPGPPELSMLAEEFGFHPLALEAVTREEQRPKLDEYKTYLLLVSCAVVDGGAPGELRIVEVDLFIGRNYLVSIHRGPLPALDEAVARWTRGGSMLGEGVGFLLYAVLDALLDAYLPRIGEIEDEIGELEAAMPSVSDDEGVQRLLRVKRTLVGLRRALYPLREIFQVLLRRDHPLFLDNSEVYLRELSNRVLRILDALETEREMVAGALDASLTVSSNRLNRTMKRLAVITVCVAAVASVFGAYGMNFQVIPLAATPWGFWAVCLGTIAVVGVGLVVARARGWW